jgi:hypothetical protein
MIRWGVFILVLLVIVVACFLAFQDYRPPAPPRIARFRNAELLHRPRHVPADLLVQLQKTHSLSEEIDIHDPEQREGLQKALLSSPWVEKILSLDRNAEGALSVHLQYRTPVAEVVILGRDRKGVEERRFVVDARGVLLPATNSELSLMSIHGVQQLPKAEPGKPFGDEGVIQAALAAELLLPHREKLGSLSIHLNLDPVIPDVQLQTQAGTIIHWQRLGESNPLLSAPNERVNWLLAYVQRFNSLDQPGGHRLDVRFEDGLHVIKP